MRDFDPLAFNELSVLSAERVRHHLLRFDEALARALASDFQCNELEAGNLVTQAHLFGFRSLSGFLTAVFFNGSDGATMTLHEARLASEAARPKIAELLTRGVS